MKKNYLFTFLFSFISTCLISQTLFFSEYAEGTSNNKYLEIYNGTGTVVDLTAYAFPNVSNDPTVVGEHEYWNTFPDGATVADGDVYVIAHPSSDQTILDQADHTFTYLSNGDDGFKLVMGTETDFTVIDVIGDFMGDPGDGWDVAGVTEGTKEHTLVRKSSILSGQTDWATSAGTSAEDSEWIVLDQNDWTNLGSHTVDAISNGCDHTFVMIDAYGDGWNGASVDLLVDGVNIATLSAADSGSTSVVTYENFLFAADEGSSISLSNWVSGSWNGEISWQILDGVGLELASGFFLDDADVVANCTPPACPAPVITSWVMGLESVSFDGTNHEQAYNYTVEYSETTFTPGDGTAMTYTFDTFPAVLAGLTSDTTYYFAMVANCADGLTSEYIGSPDEWSTTTIGSTGEAPIVIESLPYTTTDDTINYGDNYTNTATDCDGSGSYLGGDDVVYLYQPTDDMTLNVTWSPEGSWSGVYIYTSAADIGSACWIYSYTNSSNAEFSFELSVTAGTDYFFVMSTFPSPQNVAYTFSVEEISCGAPTGLSVTASDVIAIASWDGLDDGTTYLVELGDTEPADISATGIDVGDASTVGIPDLIQQTAYTVWLAAVCSDGSISAPVSTSFITAPTPPECGDTLTYDYPNSNSGGYTFDVDFDLAANDYSSDLLFSTAGGDQDGDGVTDEVTVTLSGTTESSFDWVFITDDYGNLLYGPASGEHSGSYTASDGVIHVYLAADGSVQDGPITFEVSCAGLSISENEINDLRIYPNPVSDNYVTIVSSLSGNKFVELFDINGRKVLSTSISGNMLDVSSLERGFYMTRVTIDGKSSTSKLIIN